MPGIGSFAKGKLNANGIMSTFALIGKFLTMKDLDTDPVQHCERFYQYLKSLDINGRSRSTIVSSVADKASLWMPILYDNSAYIGNQHLETVCNLLFLLK